MTGTPQIHIRDARADERPAISELTLAAYAEHAHVMKPTAWALLEQVLRNTLASDPPGEWIVAERAGALLGSVLLSPPVTQAYGGEVDQIDWPEVLRLDPREALEVRYDRHDAVHARQALFEHLGRQGE